MWSGVWLICLAARDGCVSCSHLLASARVRRGVRVDWEGKMVRKADESDDDKNLLKHPWEIGRPGNISDTCSEAALKQDKPISTVPTVTVDRRSGSITCAGDRKAKTCAQYNMF